MNAHGIVHKYGDHVDTDVIIPARYLNTQSHKELASHCMEDIDKDFIHRVKDGDIMVAGVNFGCGSSREHAPWALLDYGIRCVISTSFADIFYNNCFKNGILPIVLPEPAVAALMRDAENGANARLTVDLEAQTVTGADGTAYPFEMDPHRKHCLLNGLDDIGLTMEKAPAIDAYEARIAQSQPWV